MNIMPWLGFLIKRRKKAFLFLLVLVSLILIWFFGFYDGEDEYDFVSAEVGSVIQEVSVTGRIKSAKSIDLAFDRGGRVSYVGAKNGDKVFPGKVLIQLDRAELAAQEQKEKAGIAAAEFRLNQALAAANNDRGDASAAADLLSRALKSVVDAMVDFTSVQYEYFNNFTSSADRLAEQKESVLRLIYGQENLGRTGAWYFIALNSGLKLEIDQFQKDRGSGGQADSLAGSAKEALLRTKLALELMQTELIGEPYADQSDIAAINSRLDAVLSRISEVSNIKKNIAGEEYEINIYQAQLEQAKAALALTQAQASKYVLTAPFSGIVGNVDVKAGQIISANLPLVSLIGDSKFQIEANVSEADIAKINIGDKVAATMDAYDKDNVFPAAVIYIDPAGRVVDGVAVYKVTVEFDLSDERILSGLTADLDILTDQKNDVLRIPSRNVFLRNGKKYVKVLIDNDLGSESRFASLTAVAEQRNRKIYEVEVQTGLRGSDGNIEIIFGLKEGDKMVR